jgi:hypothetical protein
MRRRRELALGLLAAASVALSACSSSSSSSQRPCSAVGALAGIQVTLPPAARSASGAVTVKACADSQCETHRISVTSGPGSRPVVGGHLHGPSPVRVSLTIHDSAGRTLFNGSTTVTPQKDQPNGPGCPPKVWVGRVVASGSHTLTSKPLSLG